MPVVTLGAATHTEGEQTESSKLWCSCTHVHGHVHAHVHVHVHVCTRVDGCEGYLVVRRRHPTEGLIGGGGLIDNGDALHSLALQVVAQRLACAHAATR